MTVLGAIILGVVLAAVVALAAYRHARARLTTELRASMKSQTGQSGAKRCDTCLRELAPGTLRTHDGRWACPEHK